MKMEAEISSETLTSAYDSTLPQTWSLQSVISVTLKNL